MQIVDTHVQTQWHSMGATDMGKGGTLAPLENVEKCFFAANIV